MELEVDSLRDQLRTIPTPIKRIQIISSAHSNRESSGVPKKLRFNPKKKNRVQVQLKVKPTSSKPPFPPQAQES